MVSSTVLAHKTNITLAKDTGFVSASNRGETNFFLQAAPADIANYARQGNDLVIDFLNGQRLTIRGFFANGVDYHNLVLANDTVLQLVDFSQALAGVGESIIDAAVVYHPIVDSTGALLGILGTLAAGVGAVAVAAAVNGSNSDSAGGGESIIASDEGGGQFGRRDAGNNNPPRQPGEKRRPGDVRIPGDERLSGDPRIPGDKREPGDPRFPGDPRGEDDPRWWGDERRPGDPRLPGDDRWAGDPDISDPRQSGEPRRPGDPRLADDPRLPGEPRLSGDPRMPGDPRLSDDPRLPGDPRKSGDPRFPGEERWDGDPRLPGEPREKGDPRLPGEPRGKGDPRLPGDEKWDGDPDIDEPRKPGEDRRPGDPREEGDTRFPGEPREPGDPRFPGEPREPGDTRLPGEPREEGDPRLPGDPRKPGDIRLPGDEKWDGDPDISDTRQPGEPRRPGDPREDGDPRFPGEPRKDGDPRFPGEPREEGDERLPGDPRLKGDPRWEGDERWPGDPREEGDERWEGDPLYPEDTPEPGESDYIPIGEAVITKIDPDTGIDGNFITSAHELVVEGMVVGLKPGEKLEVRIGNGPWGEADVNGINWVFDNKANPLDEGFHMIQTRIVSADGKAIKPTAEKEVEIDQTDPDAPTILSVVDATDMATEIAHQDTVATNELHITGTAEAGHIVRVRRSPANGGAIVAETVADEDGNWAVATDALDDDTYHLHVRSVDVAGNRSDHALFTVTVDTTPPDAPIITLVQDNVGTVQGDIIPNGNITDDTTPTLKGTAEAGSTILILDASDGDREIGSTTVDDDGNWEVTVLELVEGSHNLTITATDAAGNVSDPTHYGMEVDLTPPDLKITLVDDNEGAIKGPIFDGGVTDDQTPTFKGTGEKGATITIKQNGVIVDTIEVAANGLWEWTPTLNNGTYNFEFVASDKAGNESAPETYSLTVSTDLPDAPIITLVQDNVGKITNPIPNGGVTDDQTPTFKGTGVAGQTITVKEGNNTLGTTVVQADGSWEWTPTTNLPEGTHTLSFTATDSDGKISSPANYTVEVDITAPILLLSKVDDNEGAIKGPIFDGGVTDDQTPTFKGTGEKGATITIKQNGVIVDSIEVAANGLWEWTPTLNNGAHNFEFVATDAAGNSTPTPLTYAFTVNTNPPTGEISILSITQDTGSSSTDFITSETSPTIHGVTSGMKSGDTAQIRIDGGAWVPVASSNGNWSYTLQNLGEKTYLIESRIVDQNNNFVAGDSKEFTIDTTAPAPVNITEVWDDVAGGVFNGNIVDGGLTNDNRPTLRGTGEAGSTITIKEGNNTLGTTTVDSNGNWQFTPTADLPDGSHTFTITAKDVAGNESNPVSRSITVDTIAPPLVFSVEDNVEGGIVGSLPNNSMTNDNTPTFKGTSEPGATITIQTDSPLSMYMPTATVTVADDGTWTFTPPTPLDDGSYYFYVTARDAAGNYTLSSYYGLKIDTVPPAVEITSVIDDTGNSNVLIAHNGTTADNTPTFNGTGEAGSTLTIKRNGTVVKTINVDNSGDWTWTSPTLNDDTYNFEFVAEDAAGNKSATPTYTLTVETQQPEINITRITPDTGTSSADFITKENVVTVHGTVENKAAADSVQVKLGNGDWTTVMVVNGKWNIQLPSLDHGDYVVQARIYNSSTGTVTSDSQAITIDTQVPNAPVISGILDDKEGGIYNDDVPDGQVTNDNTPTLTGTGEVGATVTITDNNGNVWTTLVDENGDWVQTVGAYMGQGVRTFTVTQTDTAGNESAAISRSLVIDTIAPPINITEVIDNVSGGVHNGNVGNGDLTNDNTPTFKGTSEKGATITLKVGNQTKTTTADNNGNWSITTDNLPDGTHNFTITATDAAGNESQPKTYQLEVDATPPALDITQVYDSSAPYIGHVNNGETTNDPTPIFSGTAEAGSTVRLKVGNQTKEYVVLNNGLWDLSPDDLPEGAHDFTITATDAAGNVTTKTYNLTIDLMKPKGDVFIDSISPDTGRDGSDFITNNITPTIHGHVENLDTSKGEVVQIKIGTADWVTVNVNNSGGWSHPAGTLTHGNYDIQTRIKNQWEITKESNGELLQIDTVAPNNPVITSVESNYIPDSGVITNGETYDRTPVLKGTAEANSIVTIRSGNTVIGTGLTDADGNWKVEVANANKLNFGTHNLTVTATDVAGNDSGTVGQTLKINDLPPVGVGIMEVFTNSSNTMLIDIKYNIYARNLYTNEKVFISFHNLTTGAKGKTVVSGNTEGSHLYSLAPMTQGDYQITVSIERQEPWELYPVVVDTKNEYFYHNSLYESSGGGGGMKMTMSMPLEEEEESQEIQEQQQPPKFSMQTFGGFGEETKAAASEVDYDNVDKADAETETETNQDSVSDASSTDSLEIEANGQFVEPVNVNINDQAVEETVESEAAADESGEVVNTDPLDDLAELFEEADEEVEADQELDALDLLPPPLPDPLSDDTIPVII